MPCSTCRYWWDDEFYDDPADLGYCRRHAPRPLWQFQVPAEHLEATGYEPSWPVTRGDVLCGEFERSEHLAAESER